MDRSESNMYKVVRTYLTQFIDLVQNNIVQRIAIFGCNIDLTKLKSFTDIIKLQNVLRFLKWLHDVAQWGISIYLGGFPLKFVELLVSFFFSTELNYDREFYRLRL